MHDTYVPSVQEESNYTHDSRSAPPRTNDLSQPSKAPLGYEQHGDVRRATKAPADIVSWLPTRFPISEGQVDGMNTVINVSCVFDPK